MATRTMKYRPNPSFERQIERDVIVRQALGLVAGEVASRAAGNAPRGFMGLRRSITSGDSGGDAAVLAGPGWHLVEFGSVRTAPRALFRRTLEALGMKLREGRG